MPCSTWHGRNKHPTGAHKNSLCFACFVARLLAKTYPSALHRMPHSVARSVYRLGVRSNLVVWRVVSVQKDCGSFRSTPGSSTLRPDGAIDKPPHGAALLEGRAPVNYRPPARPPTRPSRGCKGCGRTADRPPASADEALEGGRGRASSPTVDRTSTRPVRLQGRGGTTPKRHSTPPHAREFNQVCCSSLGDPGRATRRTQTTPLRPPPCQVLWLAAVPANAYTATCRSCPNSRAGSTTQTRRHRATRFVLLHTVHLRTRRERSSFPRQAARCFQAPTDAATSLALLLRGPRRDERCGNPFSKTTRSGSHDPQA